MDLIKTLKYEEGLEQVVHLALLRGLIPVFGAGFTSGCEACDGVVPDTNRAVAAMSKLIIDTRSDIFSAQDLNDLDFFDISDIFFEYVPFDNRAEYFERYYTGVKLYPQQAAFLNAVNWPYAYTLNVDDGIEKNSDFVPILPYHKVRRPRTSKRLLYKLHGDACHESQYADDRQDNIIFSQSQYMQAITREENSDIYKSLLSDYSQRHILFIGCSLQSEKDLQYVYDKCHPFADETYRIVMRRNSPSTIEQQKLKKHGINEIILVDDYEQFYSDFLQKYTELQCEVRKAVYEHINPNIRRFENKTDALKLIAGMNIFNANNNEFAKGGLHILRNAVGEITKALSTNFCVLLKGRRFSGKTFVLSSLAERYKTMDTFYFPSTEYADEDIVEQILIGSNNSLFLFDSNSVTPDVYGLILRCAEQCKAQQNKIVFAVNSNDNFLLTHLNGAVVDLKNVFKDEEIALNNKAADSFGLARRKRGHTNIDYLFVLKKDQSVEMPFEIDHRLCITSLEQSILIALCALDKLYYSDLIALDFNKNFIDNIGGKLSPFIELVPINKNESTRHSTTKLVHNSKIALIELFRSFTNQQISDSVIYLVRKFKPDYSRRRLYIEIILFDTLNQLFSGRSDSQELIQLIYTNLQPILENDLHYWLQRAKCIYRTSQEKVALDEAYTYAKKVYIDGYNNLPSKAALTTALISCAISETLPEPERLGFCEEAVILAHEAVFSEYFHLNPNYLESELPIGKNTNSERRITTACAYVKMHSSNSSFIEKSEEILKKFKIMRENGLQRR